jgi:hypothetical protein
LRREARPGRELAAQLDVVVDLAVIGQREAAIRVDEGLRPEPRVDDREPTVR